MDVQTQTHLIYLHPQNRFRFHKSLKTIGLMEQIVQTIGWTLYYSALELEQFTQKQIECA